MSRNQKIAIVVIVILAIIALILWLLGRGQEEIYLPPGEEPTIDRPLGLANSTASAAVNTPINVNAPAGEPSEPPPPPDDRANLKRLAAAFAERYGSFSNQSNFENLLDLKAFMTDSMAAETDSYVAVQRAMTQPSAEYFGMTSRAMTSEILSFDEQAGQASISVTVQRHQQTSVAGGDRVYYQEITIGFTKVLEVWKVGSAVWGEEQAVR